MLQRIALLLPWLALVHCASSEGGAARDSALTSQPTGDEADAARSCPPLPQCRYSEPRVSSICYGTRPPPDAPHSRTVCGCDACKQDSECGAGEKCILWSQMCGPALQICAKPCDAQGACPNPMVCRAGLCEPPQPAPPP